MNTHSPDASDVVEALPDVQSLSVALVGYGEVGRILAEDLRTRGVAVAVYDVKLGTAAETPLRQHAAQHGVSLTRTHAGLASQADFIVSAVTASQTVAAPAIACPMGLGIRVTAAASGQARRSDRPAWSHRNILQA